MRALVAVFEGMQARGAGHITPELRDLVARCVSAGLWLVRGCSSFPAVRNLLLKQGVEAGPG